MQNGQSDENTRTALPDNCWLARTLTFRDFLRAFAYITEDLKRKKGQRIRDFPVWELSNFFCSNFHHCH